MTSVLDSTLSSHAPLSTRGRWVTGAGGLAAAVLLVAVGTLGTATPARAATAIGLGTADSFAVLAGSGITNTGVTTITGDIGTFPTPAIDQQGSFVLTGADRTNDTAAMLQVKDDLRVAYANARGQQPPIAVTQDLATFQGGTLTGGVYNTSSSMALTGQLTLTGDGDDVFVFQAGSTLITGSDSSVVLTGGVQACNVFWQVETSATIGVRTAFQGTILAAASISATTGATFAGRLLALDGAVTMDTNTITRPGCATTTPTTTAGPTSTTPVATTPVTTTPVTTPPVTPTTGAAPTTTAPGGSTGGTGGTGGGAGSGAGRGGSSTTGSGGYSQVAVVPVGSVDTGDGSTA